MTEHLLFFVFTNGSSSRMIGEKSSIFTYSHNVSKAAENSLIWNTVGFYIWNIYQYAAVSHLNMFSFLGV
jgi:hypothetical protein